MKLFYTFERCKEHDYQFTYIRIFSATPKTLKELIEGTVDNKDGYGGGQDTADDMRGRFERVLGLGWTHVLELSHWGPRVTFKWQHYRSVHYHDFSRGKAAQYCESNVDIGNTYNEIQRNNKLVNRIVKRLLQVCGLRHVHYHTLEPKRVIQTLKAMRVKYVTLMRFGEYDRRYCYTTRKKKPVKDAKQYRFVA
jgi:hypothetical protein